MSKVTQNKRQEPSLSTGFAQFEPMVPCQGSLMAERGYVKVDGRWVAPSDRSDEMDTMRMRPKLVWGSSG